MFILADIDKSQLFLVRNFDLVVMQKIKEKYFSQIFFKSTDQYVSKHRVHCVSNAKLISVILKSFSFLTSIC